MAVTISGTSGITTPGVTNAGNETIAGTLQVGGVTTNVYPLVSGTAVASTSGTYIDFTSIPSWVKRITVMFDGVSTSGAGNYLIQLGDSGGIESSGYISYAAYAGGGGASGNSSTAGYILNGGTPGTTWTVYGNVVISLLNQSTNTWTASVCLGMYNTAAPYSLIGGGSKSLSATLDRVRITTSNGTDTFDAGSINILYE